jgi:hypothetical protein
MTYLTGHVKRDPVTKSVAIKTIFPDNVPELAGQSWLVATVNFGPRTAPTEAVASWDDIYTPEG